MSRRFGARFLLIATAICGVALAASVASAEPLTMEDAKKLKSPVAYSKASIARGKVLYLRKCTECHGADGKSLVDVVANATDLTDPDAWLSGTSEGEVYRSIRDGAGEAESERPERSQ